MRVLVFGVTENVGGRETFLFNYYRYIDRNRIQFDLLCNTYKSVAYEKEFMSLGARVFHITARSNNFRLYHKELKEVFENHADDWDAIWVNVCSLANIDYLKYAKRYGIEKKIIHSHNSRNADSKLRGILHYWNKIWIDQYATDFWACSEEAAAWFYSKKVIDKTIIIHNAIEVKQFQYDGQKRQHIRERLGLQDEYVIGNVGRLTFQKNQKFILEIFECFVKLCPKSRLVLVGQGEDEKMLKKKAQSLGISDKVLFAGLQTNIDAWLSAFDLFLFPSLYEGFPIAPLEAEANGIPVLASSGVIPKGVKLNDNFMFCNLDEGAKKWADMLLKMKERTTREPFKKVQENFIKNGYEIGNEVKKLEKLLIE